MLNSSNNTAPDASKSVLGAILLRPDCVSDVQEILLPEINDWFYEPKHNLVYNTCVAMHQAAKPIDAVTLMSELENHLDRNVIENAGGYAYISDLASTVPTTANVLSYADTVSQAYVKRHAIDVGGRLKAAAQNGVHANDLLTSFQVEIQGLEDLRRTKTEDRWMNVGSWLDTDPPAIDYLFEDRVSTNILASLYAPGNSGKGYFTQALAMSLCTGRTLIPTFRPCKPRNVIWLSAEDDNAELHRRARRIGNQSEMTRDDSTNLSSRLYVWNYKRGESKHLTQKSPEGDIVPSPSFFELLKAVSEIQPGLIILDPQSHFFGGEENSNSEMAQFMSLLQQLILEVEDGCTIWLNHHTSKARQSDPTSESGRGAVSARDAMRLIYTLTPIPQKECVEAGISDSGRYIRLTEVKNNYTPQMGKAIDFHRGTGATAGTLTEVDLDALKRDSEAGAFKHLVKNVVELIGENSNRYTVNELCKGGSGNEKIWGDVREHLKEVHGDHIATQKNIRDAINQAIETGLLNFTDEPAGRTTRRIPFRAT